MSITHRSILYFCFLLQISAAVAFLLSPGAAYITGESIKVDGASSLYMPPGGYTVRG